MKRKRSIIVAVSSLTTIAVMNALFVNCSSNMSATTNTIPTNTTPTATITPMPTMASQGCTAEQLNQLDANLSTSLEAAITDVDFSLQLETEDGRRFNFNRGSSTMNTPYQSASTSKWVSATIILSFMESAINQASSNPLTLSAHPQDFIEASNWTITPTDSLYSINLRHLLSFTSGLENEPPCVNTYVPNMGFASCVKAIADKNLGSGIVPATRFAYSSNHLQVAGLMAMRARDIAKGLTLGTSTWQDLVSEFKTKTSLFANSVYDIPSTINPRLAGGMHWTGNDYFDFVKASYLKQILSSQIMPGQTSTYYNQQFSDQISSAEIIGSPVSLGIGEDWHYGFGLWSECHSPTYNCGTNVESFSSPGAYGAYPFINRSKKFYGIIARQGELGTFRNGFDLYTSVSEDILKWAEKDCP